MNAHRSKSSSDQQKKEQQIQQNQEQQMQTYQTIEHKQRVETAVSGALPVTSQRRDQIDQLKGRAKEIESKLKDLKMRSITPTRSITPVRNDPKSPLPMEKSLSSQRK